MGDEVTAGWDDTLHTVKDQQQVLAGLLLAGCWDLGCFGKIVKAYPALKIPPFATYPCSHQQYFQKTNHYC